MTEEEDLDYHEYLLENDEYLLENKEYLESLTKHEKLLQECYEIQREIDSIGGIVPYLNYYNDRIWSLEHENMWIPKIEEYPETTDIEIDFGPPQIMSQHSFKDSTVKFYISSRCAEDIYTKSTIDYCTVNCEEYKNGKWNLSGLKDVGPIKDIETAKILTAKTVLHFDQKQNVKIEDIMGYIHSLNEQQLKEEQLLKTENIKKAGYVQGVCECVAIVDNTKLGKKLLSEMKVTQDMAKQYADPKTYESMEKTVFAPKPVQEQKQSRKR